MKRKNKKQGYFNGLCMGFSLCCMTFLPFATYMTAVLYEPRVEYTVDYQVPVSHDDIGLERITLNDIEAML